MSGVAMLAGRTLVKRRGSDMITRADGAMNRAKRGGRDRVVGIPGA
jgi:PleD family two-component response regulator